MNSNRRSIRLPGYDYASAGWYFVTICCHKRQNLFGEIQQGEMVLNAAGEMVEECWFNIPKHFPNAELHEFVVMPNHVHGIIELTVRAENFLPLQPIQHEFQTVIPISVASIVKGFKIGVTKWMRQNTHQNQIWQRNYYEHIIRNDESYRRIANYIVHNPQNWQEDEYFPARDRIQNLH